MEKLGDPPLRLDSIVDCTAFRSLPIVIQQKQRKRNVGRNPHPLMQMLMRILQAPYNRSADQTELQVCERLSFQRVLGCRRNRPSPMPRRCGCSVRNYNDRGLIDKLFLCFDEQIWESGLSPRAARPSMPVWSAYRRIACAC